MSVHKRRNRSGEIVWAYRFDAHGSTKARRRQVSMSGFATKNEASNAEAVRRVEVQKEYEEAQAVKGGQVLTLAGLLTMFFEQHGPDLAPKTFERYREMAK